MSKTFTVDTSVLLYDVDSLYKFDDNTVVIPSVVYEEINDLKEEDSERGYYARRVAEILEEISLLGSVKEGVMFGKTFIRKSYEIYNKEVSEHLTSNKNDYKIIACAKNNNSILISRDRMMRTIARDFVEVEDYQADKVQTTDLYKGYRKAIVPPEQIQAMFEGRLENDYNLYPNQFIIMEDEWNPQHVGVGICKQSRIIPCDFDKLYSSKTVHPKLRALNLEQKMFIYLLLDPDVTCITATGTSGKGKSLLAIDVALAYIDAKFYNKFLYTKSTIAVDKREELGFYKGGVEEKLKPHLQPLYSSVEFLFKEEIYKGKQRMSVDEKVQELLDADILNFYPLANIRGMSIFDKIVMLDEAQNTTNHMIKSLVTRVNDSSKLIVIGDIDQIDDKNLNKYNNGLVHLIEAGKEEDMIGHITMDIDDKSKRGKLSAFGAKKL